MDQLLIPLLTFAAVATAGYTVLQLGGRSKRLASRIDAFTNRNEPAPAHAAGGAVPAEVNLLREQKYSNWALLDQMIARRSWAEREAAELTRAYVPLRVGEFLMIRVVLALALVTVGWIALKSPFLALPLAVPGFFLPLLWIKHKQKKRRA